MTKYEFIYNSPNLELITTGADGAVTNKFLPFNIEQMLDQENAKRRFIYDIIKDGTIDNNSTIKILNNDNYTIFEKSYKTLNFYNILNKYKFSKPFYYIYFKIFHFCGVCELQI